MRLRSTRWIATAAAAASLLAAPGSARAGKLAWLDDVVREVVREADAGGKVAARGADEAGGAARSVGKLFVREAADEGLDVVARRAEGLARAGSKAAEEPSEALLKARFSRLVPDQADLARTFATLAPAEKRLVVEMGETARRLAIRYPGRAEPMIRELGTDGLAAVRVFGDDVAETLAKEGPASLGVLRKTGRTGWRFFNDKVLPNKGKLAAAGVLGLYLADPDKFVDTAGRATRYAVEQFARAGVALAGAVGDATVRGLGGSFEALLASWGIPASVARVVGIGAAVLVVLGSLLVLVGAPVRWMLRPFRWAFRLAGIGRKSAASALR
jgi:hypothetical protein